MFKRLLIFAVTVLLVGPLPGIAGSLQDADRAESYYHFSLAKLYAEDQKFAEAIAEFEKALALDPESARLHYEFAATLRQAGAINRAMNEGRRSVELDPNDPAPHLLLGGIYYRAYQRGSADMLEAAVSAWKKVIELDPSEAEALYYLALHYFEQKDFAKAASTFHRLNQVRPGYTRGYLSEAHALIEMEQLEEAIAVLEKSLEYQTDDPETLELLGRLLEETFQEAKALEVYERLVSVSPTPALRYRTGVLLSRAGRFDRALPMFRKLVEDDPDNQFNKIELGKALEGTRKYQEAAEILGQVAEKLPDHQEANYYLASCLRALGKRAEAIERVQHLLEITKNQRPPSPYENRFKSFLAILYQEDRQYDKAVETFEEICRDDPSDDRAKLGLVYALEDAEQLEAAVSLSEQLLSEEPEELERQDLIITHARVLAAAGRLDESISLLRAEMKETGQEDFYLAAGQIYLEQKRFAEAEEMVLDGLKLKPDSQQMHFQLAALMERQGKYEDAEAKFKEILSSNPDHGAVLNYLGYMLADRGVRLDEAREYVVKALELDPHNGAYLDSLGWVYFKLDELELSEANLIQASQVNDSDPTIFEHLGDLYLRLGDQEKARAYYKKSISFAEDAEERQKVEEKLAALSELPNESGPN